VKTGAAEVKFVVSSSVELNEKFAWAFAWFVQIPMQRRTAMTKDA
jgi:hypothetical protein